jgi:hypothetical protein
MLKGGDMATPIDHLIEKTPRGVKIRLDTLYVYPDGHANLTFSDGTNWPMANPYEIVDIIVEELLTPMQRRTNKAHPAQVPI